MWRAFLLCLLILSFHVEHAHAQLPGTATIRISVVNADKAPLPGSTIALMTPDSVVLKTAIADTTGLVIFLRLRPGIFLARATRAGHLTAFTTSIRGEAGKSVSSIVTLMAEEHILQTVTVASKRPLIEFLPDKTVINPEANITNAGASVMDVLEKSPGITVGKDGTIIMKGKPAVTVLIDGKLTQLSGSDLQAYLSGISAAQVDRIELIENPGARFDASGNAGIINIRTKSNRQQGFNGSFSVSAGQGFYPKSGNSVNLNYRNGRINLFLNYGLQANRQRQKSDLLRRYFNTEMEDSLLLAQPNVTRTRQTGHSLKTGLDFFVSEKTTLGLVFTGGIFHKKERSSNTIDWMQPDRRIDSSINTFGENDLEFNRGGINLNGRHQIGKGELSADLDYVRFQTETNQYYETLVLGQGGTMTATTGLLPASLHIYTAKVDYSRRIRSVSFEAGMKTAINKTDNLADYQSLNNGSWEPDLGRSNHFLYDERITGVYSSADAEHGRFHAQLGLRYEATSYNARQLGNAQIRDSAFRRNYGGLFPSAFVSYEMDSANVFTVRTGRRIDRPAFQNLNPFVTIQNKYTYEAGNPYIRPQYTWNVAIAHTYRQKLTTEISYSNLRDYFSQIFVIDSNSTNVNQNIILYTRGNVGSFQNLGITETFQQAITPWWNLTAVATLNRKIIRGVVWAPLVAKVTQLNVSLNNQFQLKKGWAFEISGYYQTRSQIDLQEWLKPQGELDLGVSKQVLKNTGSLKLSVRDLTYFQNYSGFSIFQNAYEPFTLQWDSRVVRLSFNWRFGKTMKAVIRSEGGAADEIERAGTGN